MLAPCQMGFREIVGFFGLERGGVKIQPDKKLVNLKTVGLNDEALISANKRGLDSCLPAKISGSFMLYSSAPNGPMIVLASQAFSPYFPAGTQED